MISEFVKQFGDIDIEHTRLGDMFYQVENMPSVKENLVHAGLYLGEIKRNKFYPSLCLLDMISKKSKRKLYVNDKAEWLFLCGRDLMARSVVRSEVNEGLVLVQNSKDENLGYGMIIGNINNKDKDTEDIVVKNLLDKGNYLRREMKR